MKKENIQNYQTVANEQPIIRQEKKPSIFRRVLKTMAWTFGVLIIIAMILVFVIPKIFSLAWGRDIPVPNDRDLLLSVVNIPKNENSYFDLVKLSDILDGETKKSEIKIEIPTSINDMKYLESYDWDNDKIEELLNNNKEALFIYDIASRKPQFQYDFTSDPSNIKFPMPIVSLNPWRQISRISSIKAIYLMKQGNVEEAFSESFKSVIIGHNIESSKNIPLITYLVGIAIKKTGLETMQVLISNMSGPTEILSKYQNELKKYPSSNNGDIFRNEYTNNKKTFHLLNPEFSQGIEKEVLENNFYYKPNLTLEYFINHYRQFIEISNKPCSDRSIVTAVKPEISWKLYFTENAVGKTLSTLAVVALNNVRDKKCNNEALLNLTDSLFAIKKYRLEKGNYPESLSGLNQYYVSGLPNDPFNGEALLFDKNRMTISSVGPDQKNGNSDDISVNYNFK